jgi:hypothetical protein
LKQVLIGSNFVMGLIFSCRGLPIPENGPDDFSDTLHLLEGKTISSSKIAGGAGRGHVRFDVRQRIVNAVKAARFFYGAAMNAWLANKTNHFINSQIALINSLVCLSEKNSAALNCLPVYSRNFFAAYFLFWRQTRPSLRAPITPFLSCRMANPALICKTERARGIAQKIFCRCGKFFFATMTNTVSGLGAVIFPHAHNVGARSPFVNCTTKGSK